MQVEQLAAIGFSPAHAAKALHESQVAMRQ
jgi:hypothetical protein